MVRNQILTSISKTHVSWGRRYSSTGILDTVWKFFESTCSTFVTIWKLVRPVEDSFFSVLIWKL